MTPSVQDYLKAILELSEESAPIKSIDIASVLGHSRASVSKAMNRLKDAGYISKEKYSSIALTDFGRKTADEIKKRNQLIQFFLTDILGVEVNTAKGDACRMEHAISIETAEKLEKYLLKDGLARETVNS